MCYSHFNETLKRLFYDSRSRCVGLSFVPGYGIKAWNGDVETVYVKVR